MSNFPESPIDGALAEVANTDGSSVQYKYDKAEAAWKIIGKTGGGDIPYITTKDVITTAEPPLAPAGWSGFSVQDDLQYLTNQKLVNWYLAEKILISQDRPPIIQSTAPTEHPNFPGLPLHEGDLWLDNTDPEKWDLYAWDEANTEWVTVDPDRPPIVKRTAPTEHPKFPGKPLKEGDFWLDDSDATKMLLYAWDLPNATWVPIGESGRPPIFSDTEPTVHPDFVAPDNQLETGDIWYDTTDPDEVVQYIYNGTDWLKVGGDFVHRKGGDSMEGPLQITGNRSPNADGIESTLKVLNIDSAQSSTLNLKWDGATKVYVGEKDMTLVNDLKFNVGGKAIYAEGTNKKGFVVNKDGVFYDGNYTVDRHIATKKNVDEAIFNDTTDPDSNKFVKVDGDTMTGQLEMVGNRVVFNNIPDGGQVIRANRSAGTDVDLLYLAHNGGQVQGFYDVRMTGNTSYNGIRFKGGSGGDSPIFEMRANGNYNIFYSDLRFDGNRIIDLGDAVEDTDAVTYGQVKQELADFRDSVVQELSFGTWSYSSNQVTPFQTRFYVRGSNGATSNVSAALVDTLVFNVEDLYGNVGPFDRVDVGELFTLTREGIVLKYRVTEAPTISGSQNDGRVIGVNFISQSQSTTFAETQVWNVQLTEFSEISVDQLDDTYLRLDTSNDPLDSLLTIQTPSFGEAKLTLKGKRDNANNTCATIEFNNQEETDFNKIGYITYFNKGTDQRFEYNQDIYLKGGVDLSFSDAGAIQHNGGDRIVFNSADNGNIGSGLVNFTRPGNNSRRGVAFKGKYIDSDGNTVNNGDLFFSYTNSDQDAVNYFGKTTGANNIQTYASVQANIADALGNIDKLNHTPFISNGSVTVSGVNDPNVGSNNVAGFYTAGTANGSVNQYVGNINSYLKCGNKVISTQAGANSYADLPVGYDLEFSGIVTVLDRNTGGVLYKNTVTRVQCAQDSGNAVPHVKIWVRDAIGSPQGRKPMFAFGQVTDWNNVSVLIEGYYLG